MISVTSEIGPPYQWLPSTLTPWPEGYFEVLKEAGVPENQHPFYAHWVRQLFNRNPGRPRRSLGPQEISDFLDAVDSDPDAQKWQREQARDALILYYEQFRGISLRTLPALLRGNRSRHRGFLRGGWWRGMKFRLPP